MEKIKVDDKVTIKERKALTKVFKNMFINGGGDKSLLDQETRENIFYGVVTEVYKLGKYTAIKVRVAESGETRVAVFLLSEIRKLHN